ncbi:hypothetical protein DCAR_0311495 [Daucus carota subsp. sativus]|uniref:Uncharacterized protein n=1 Tax=Daucus carota subsp. sativus TaxID=79200 RepID=A0A166AKW6_DAUCS|nr:PREDICTED: uncharacterized protein LOC108210964 [Daucus carota subsp. sativus]WOG92232.1 hypothetical protein DCAR_0311495 [Daucus carota subsp. sativus]
MEFWQRARSFAEDAAKRSQELTLQAARRSQEFTAEAARRSQEEFSIGSSKLSDIVSEATKRSKEIASEVKVEAIKRADQIKSQIPTASVLSQLVDPAVKVDKVEHQEDLETFGVTEELREFVKDITINTFKDFPIQDDSEVSDIPTVSNIRQDLTKWQEVHAKLVLSTVKEISKLRYELCPRVMKERMFWRIYFILVNNHVAPYEKRYNEDAKRISAEKVKDDIKISEVGTVPKPESGEAIQKSKSVSSAATEQDLDVFLLGDHGDSDDGQDDKDDGYDDDDFDKL